MDFGTDATARHCLAVLRIRIRGLRILDRVVVIGTFRRTSALHRLPS